MSFKGIATGLLIGFGVGAVITLLFAPKSGDELREWISDSSRQASRRLRRKGRRSVQQVQDIVARGQETVAKTFSKGNGKASPDVL